MPGTMMIAVVFLLLIVVLLSVFLFVPFGGKKLFCPKAGVEECEECEECEKCDEKTSNATCDGLELVDSANCAVAGFSSNSEVIPAGYVAESTFNKSWCTTKYGAELTTTSLLCTTLTSNLNDIVSAVSNVFIKNTYIAEVAKSESSTTMKWYKLSGTPPNTTISILTPGLKKK